MVEAAIVLPLVILSVMAMIYLLINIYSTVSLQSYTHILLREESGRKSETLEYDTENGQRRDKIRSRAETSNIDIIYNNGLMSDYVEGKKTSLYTVNMFIEKRPKVKTYGKSFVYREADIVRFKQIVAN